jgi:hypothetical protein
MAVFTNRLTEVEVRKRLALCKQTEVIDEVYTFGQMLFNEAITNFRGLDTKAGTLAAYGAAIVTLLVSSSSTWLRLGNRWTAVFGLLAGLTAFLAVHNITTSFSSSSGLVQVERDIRTRNPAHRQRCLLRAI